jgi:hypothetical protein
MSQSGTSIELIQPTRPNPIAILPMDQSEGQVLSRISSRVHPQREPTVTAEEDEDEVSKSQTVIVISSVTVITGISSLLAGLVTVGLPTIARDLKIPTALLLWYVHDTLWRIC